MFESFRGRMDKLFTDHGGRGDLRGYAAGLRDAVVDARVAVGTMRDGLAASERESASESKQLADAERRGALAAGVTDAETVAVAERFAARHRERLAVLERKVAVQRDELAMAERELAEMTDQLRQAQLGIGPAPASRQAPDAAADREAELLSARADRALHEAAVDAQLAHLKRKLGRD